MGKKENLRWENNNVNNTLLKWILPFHSLLFLHIIGSKHVCKLPCRWYKSVVSDEDITMPAQTVSCIMLSKPLNLSDLDLRGSCPGPCTWQTSKWIFLLSIFKDLLFLFDNHLSQWEGLLSWTWPPGQGRGCWPENPGEDEYSLCPYQGLNGCLGIPDSPYAAPSLLPPSSEDVDL